SASGGEPQPVAEPVASSGPQADAAPGAPEPPAGQVAKPASGSEPQPVGKPVAESAMRSGPRADVDAGTSEPPSGQAPESASGGEPQPVAEPVASSGPQADAAPGAPEPPAGQVTEPVSGGGSHQVAEPVAPTGPQPVAAPGAPLASPPAAVAGPGPQVPPRTRRRGATVLLIAVAAVIGVVAGTAVGYGVQAEREPTPLPALSQRNLTYPAKPLAADKRPAPLSAAEDRQVRTDGDLRKLLLPKPSGERVAAEKWRTGAWIDLPEQAMEFEDPGYMLGELLEDDFRRAAGTRWETGNRTTEITLLQFRSARGAQEFIAGQQGYMGEDSEESSGAGNEGDPVKGSGNGRYYLYEVERKAGYLPFYRARALVHRGDIAIGIDVVDSKAISKKMIRTLAERQLERL
ncbi:hypothetical protein ACIBCM_25580, partial [Streptomyces sp. NPDC051018]|uniref:hypothetical protein n=1 Tax=Streptomyces sp. NPDC051018 TaxID=3365639 RepID=UPI0037BC82B0